MTELDGDSTLPIMLQEIDSKVVGSKKCKVAGITAGEICVSNVNGTDGACFGDSGGPALQKITSKRWSLVGTTSRLASEGCGTGNTVYTDSAYFRRWMYDVMRTGKVPASTIGSVRPKHTSTTLSFNAWRQ
jgi:secreted trypsin-like serine protease